MHRDPNAVIADTRKRQMLVSMLDQLCQQLDLSESQYETARSCYESIGEWLAEGSDEFLQNAVIYAHGSIGLGTANKPIGRNEFDVDLMCHLPAIGPNASAVAVKALVGTLMLSRVIGGCLMSTPPSPSDSACITPVPKNGRRHNLLLTLLFLGHIYGSHILKTGF